MEKPTQNRIVNFFANEHTKEEKLPKAKKDKEFFTAIVHDVNEDSVDLTVFGGGAPVEINNIKHASVAEEGHSYWDWPTRGEA